MHFTPSKCKVMVQDWLGVTPTLNVAGSQFEVVDSFVYVGSTISSADAAREKVKSSFIATSATFTNLRHLWTRQKRVWFTQQLFVQYCSMDAKRGHCGKICASSLFLFIVAFGISHVRGGSIM